jgi:alanine dehydrogenase
MFDALIVEYDLIRSLHSAEGDIGGRAFALGGISLQLAPAIFGLLAGLVENNESKFALSMVASVAVLFITLDRHRDISADFAKNPPVYGRESRIRAVVYIYMTIMVVAFSAITVPYLAMPVFLALANLPLGRWVRKSSDQT